MSRFKIFLGVQLILLILGSVTGYLIPVVVVGNLGCAAVWLIQSGVNGL